MLCGTGPAWQADVGDVGGTGQYGSGRGNASERSRLNLLLSFSLQKGQGQNGLIESYGEHAQPLESFKSKYLAVSPVTDKSELLDKKVNGRSHHSSFSSKKLKGEPG